MELAEHVLVSLLAVNSWSLERVYNLRGGLREAGLVDFDAVEKLSIEEVAERLSAAGYTRGDYMNTLMALRISSMAPVLSAEELERLSEDVEAGRRDDANALLRRIKGVGPSVLTSFWVLRGLPETR